MPPSIIARRTFAVDGFVATTCRRIVTGDHIFIDSSAKSTANVGRWVDVGVPISGTVSLGVE
jgi:hypothetical protein